LQTPKAYLLPSLYPPDRYRTRMASAAILAKDLTSGYLQLFNNATLGRYLFVYSFTYAGQNGSSSVVYGCMQGGQISGGTSVAVQMLKADEPLCEGLVTYGGSFSSGSSTISQVLGNTLAGFYYWPYPYPLAIIPPGQSYVIGVAGSSITMSMGIGWYAGEQTDRAPLITEDVLDLELQ
jgi:hypothetical protein